MEHKIWEADCRANIFTGIMEPWILLTAINPILTEINSVHSLRTYLFKLHFNIINPYKCIAPGRSRPFSFFFPTKVLMGFATYEPPDSFAFMWQFYEEHKLRSFSLQVLSTHLFLPVLQVQILNSLIMMNVVLNVACSSV
jgi:hypothetical protein